MSSPAIFLVAAIVLSALPLHGEPVEIAPSEFRGAIQPQVAVAPGGQIHVVFGKGTALYHAGSADGRRFTPPVKIGELEKLALGMRRGPRIAATDQDLVVTAISHADGNLHAWTSQDNGSTWHERPHVNDRAKSAIEGLQALAGDGHGFVFATWLDDREGGKQVWGASSPDGGQTWGANVLIYKSPDGPVCPCCHPSVAVDATGRVAVMWRNALGGSRDFYLARSADRGKTFGAAEKLGSGTWKMNACPMDGGSLAIGPKGEAETVWRRERTIFASVGATEQRLSAAGAQPLVLYTKRGASFLWESDGALMSGQNPGSPTRFAEHAHMAAGAPLPDGRAIVVWESTAGPAPSLVADFLP